ncbi:twin-arginine translocase TatA/TatE family subunit [Bdellovibrionota bacterium FG-2]
MFGLSAGHLLVLGIVVLLFGSRRLPELGAGLGKGFKAFKEAVDGKGISSLMSDDTREARAETVLSVQQINAPQVEKTLEVSQT